MDRMISERSLRAMKGSVTKRLNKVARASLKNSPWHIKKLMEAVQAAKECLGGSDNDEIHGEDCPRGDIDYCDEKDICECGADAWRESLKALEKYK